MSSKISLCHYTIGHLGLRIETKLVFSSIVIAVLLGFTQVPIQYAEGGGLTKPPLIPSTIPVGGVFEPVNEVVLYGEVAKQYSIWLIPVIGIGVGVYLTRNRWQRR